MRLKIETYVDSKNEHRWRVKRGGRVVAESGEGYKRKSTMMRVLARYLLACGELALAVSDGNSKIEGVPDQVVAGLIMEMTIFNPFMCRISTS